MAGQLIKRGPRTYLVRVYLGRDEGGKRRYRAETVHGTKQAAQQVLTRLEHERDRGRLPLVHPKATVDEYLDAWLLTTAKPSVRPRTLDDYTDTLKRYVRPHVGRMRLAKVSPPDVRAMLVALTGLGLAPRTVRKAHEVLRNALEQAVADRLIRDNPARGRLVKKAMPRKEQTERATVTPETLPAFLAAAAEDRLYAYWCVLVFGGLRPEEALALRWSDFDGTAVEIRRVLVDRPGLPHDFAPPKSASSRRAVVMPRAATEALREHRKRQAEERLAAGPAWTDENLIYTTPTGGKLKQDQTRDRFKAVLAAAELPPMRIYDLRHSAATLLLAAGEDLKVVSERLGHSTITLTADVYAHVTRGMQQGAADKLDAIAVRGASNRLGREGVR